MLSANFRQKRRGLNQNGRGEEEREEEEVKEKGNEDDEEKQQREQVRGTRRKEGIRRMREGGGRMEDGGGRRDAKIALTSGGSAGSIAYMEGWS